MQTNSYASCLDLSPAICRNSLIKCALQPKIAENSVKTPFGGLRSFKVIDVNKSKKPFASACYDKQHVHVCTYLRLSGTVFTLHKPIAVK